MAEARAVLLSGEHPTLPEADLRALLAVHDPAATVDRTFDRVAMVLPGHEAACDAGLRRMALARAWGAMWADVPDDPRALGALAMQVRERAAAWCGGARPTVAVRPVRTGADKSPNAEEVARRLGQALADAGHPIDLKSPGLEVFAWFTEGRLLVGRLGGTIDRTRYEGRIAERRAHFSPVVLHPRRAASLVHLAQVPPGGRVLDPFCGTGGIVLEAALDGLDAWGSDIDPKMVQGTLQALANDGPEALDGTAFVADAAEAPALVPGVQAIVTDLPYGAASTTRGEDVAALYHRAFAAWAEALPHGARVVAGAPSMELLERAADGAFDIEAMHEEFVHRGLTRHYGIFVNAGRRRGP